MIKYFIALFFKNLRIKDNKRVQMQVSLIMVVLRTDISLKIIKNTVEQKTNSNIFAEILAYDPKTDEKVTMNSKKIAWEIPEIMKKQYNL
ncbi:hypothetical protein F0358_14115 [Empedobacter brevis]|uniref:hypothetical protein n=1 Tax=Empedobacter brevis TaxID=247 RepID=UPI00123D0E5C|nr:hypothetical protein [Empedobacter brevis]QES93775.1 hypothetical protein F0358_14115 [Empedobacter brevis]